MLNIQEFLRLTVINGLFYLRTMREFCANIQLSFLEKNASYAKSAEEFASRCEKLGATLIKYANGSLDQFSLDSQIFVTKYTLPCELLTEELFGIKIATNITKAQMQLKSGVLTNLSEEDFNVLMDINKQALDLTREFNAVLKDIFKKEKANELFSYSYPHLIKYMMEEVGLYSSYLEKLINKQKVDPTFVTDYEYMFLTSMRDTSWFIRSFVNPSDQEIYIKAESYSLEFDNLLTEYKSTSLSPDNQKFLTTKALKVVTRFSDFLAKCIEELLASKLYFIVEPIFLDNMYTESNFFKYILTLNQETEQNY